MHDIEGRPAEGVDDACAYQKLNPTILMMKSAEDRPSSELAKPLDRPRARRILVQRQMRSEFLVIAGVGRRIRRKWPSPKTTI